MGYVIEYDYGYQSSENYDYNYGYKHLKKCNRLQSITIAITIVLALFWCNIFVDFHTRNIYEDCLKKNRNCSRRQCYESFSSPYGPMLRNLKMFNIFPEVQIYI